MLRPQVINIHAGRELGNAFDTLGFEETSPRMRVNTFKRSKPEAERAERTIPILIQIVAAFPTTARLPLDAATRCRFFEVAALRSDV